MNTDKQVRARREASLLKNRIIHIAEEQWECTEFLWKTDNCVPNIKEKTVSHRKTDLSPVCAKRLRHNYLSSIPVLVTNRLNNSTLESVY